jgi:hypothetical protein
MTSRSEWENIQVRIIQPIVNVKIGMFSCIQGMLYRTALPEVWSSYKQSCEDFFPFLLRTVLCVKQTYFYLKSVISITKFGVVNLNIWPNFLKPRMNILLLVSQQH